MTLYLETVNGDFIPWTGAPINGVRHPPSIEHAWTAEALAEIDLYSPVETAVPSGKMVTSTTVQRVSGVVKYIYTYADIPTPDPSEFPLTDRQLRLGLIMNGISLEVIDAAINSIADPTQRAVAKVWWDRSISIEWNHVMTQTLIELVGITQEQAAAMWIAARNISA